MSMPMHIVIVMHMGMRMGMHTDLLDGAHPILSYPMHMGMHTDLLDGAHPILSYPMHLGMHTQTSQIAVAGCACASVSIRLE